MKINGIDYKVEGILCEWYETAIAKGEVAMIEMWWDPNYFEQELKNLDKISEIDLYSNLKNNANDSSPSNDSDVEEE